MLRGRLHDQKYIYSHHNLKETLKLHDSNRKTLCNQYENAFFNLTNTRLVCSDPSEYGVNHKF